MPARVAEAKAALRLRLGAQRRAATPVAGAGDALAQALLASPCVAAARRIALYAALPGELPTRPAFERLRAAGSELVLPAPGPGRALVFRRVERWSELEPGRWGVPTPPPEAVSIDASELDVAVLPGVAFDRRGNRLGRGGGHYDATFGALEAGPLLVGAAWSFQLVEAVPCDSRDRRVDAIVTEEGCVANPGRPL